MLGTYKQKPRLLLYVRRLEDDVRESQKWLSLTVPAVRIVEIV